MTFSENGGSKNTASIFVGQWQKFLRECKKNTFFPLELKLHEAVLESGNPALSIPTCTYTFMILTHNI